MRVARLCCIYNTRYSLVGHLPTADDCAYEMGTIDVGVDEIM